ncbi:MAG: hypothetical protein WED04_11930 [Promethearchaeati archaeon SRVP18_Atabeyarchaeia-1]
MSGIESLADKIRDTLIVLNVPVVQGMAIYAGRKQAYSDLGSLSLSRIAPFTESFMLLGLGDNFSLALEEGKTIIVSRISERAALIVVTDQRIGTVLTKIREVIEKYGNEVDAVLQGQPVPPPKEVLTTSRAAPPPSISLQEKAVPKTTPPAPPKIVTPKTPLAPTVKVFMAPFLIDKAVLKSASGDEKKILSLCTGRFSIEEISKKTRMSPKTVIETVYRYSQKKTLDLREEKKTSEEEAVDFLKGL